MINFDSLPFISLSTRLGFLLSTLVISGCLSYPDPYSSKNTPINDIAVGAVVKGELINTDANYQGNYFDVYRFSAQPGTQVTITARSDGPDLKVWLSRSVEKVGNPYNRVIANDNDVGENDHNSAHSEIIATLPDDDGQYFIWVYSMPKNPFGTYSISLLEGYSPAADIVDADYVPHQIIAPEPIYGNTGKYMSPFTEDGTVTKWVEKGLLASVGMSVGQSLGTLAASAQDSNNVGLTLAGGVLGALVGREAMMASFGGREYIKETSDLSFDSLDDMARYLIVHNSKHPQYQDVLKATSSIYPGLSSSIFQVQKPTQ